MYFLNAFSVVEEAGKFSATFSRAARAPFTFREEVIATAKQIVNTARQPLWLCLSGGLASMLIAHILFEEGIEFSAITLAFSTAHNSLAFQRAKKWCRDRALRHDVIDIDMSQFLAQDVVRHASRYPSHRISRFLQLRLLEEVTARKGIALMGGGQMALVTLGSSGVSVQLDSDYKNLLRWCDENQAFHVPYFFSSRPELALAYTEHPLVHAALASPRYFENDQNHVLLQRFVYYAEWPQLEMIGKQGSAPARDKEFQGVIAELQNISGGSSKIHVPLNDALSAMRQIAVAG